MVRALLLLAAAAAVAFLPVSRMIRVVVIVMLLAAAGVVGFLVETQQDRRESRLEERGLEEETHWQAPQAGLVQVTGIETLAPLRFRNHWSVDAVVRTRSEASDQLTGIEVTAEAWDCPSADAPLAECRRLGSDVASETFLPIGAGASREVRLRFEYPGAAYPERRLRLVPTISAVRR